ncbi:MAG: flagellar biosynthesis protein FlhF [Rubrivivax sp.]
MNVKRFTARTSREALKLVKMAFGSDAVVLSTRPCPEGIEVLAMAPESVGQLERLGAAADADAASARVDARPSVPREPAAPRRRARASLAERAATAAPAYTPGGAGERREPVFDASVTEDVERLSMSTLSFQDYVRERMLRRRKAEMEGAAAPGGGAASDNEAMVLPFARPQASSMPAQQAPVLTQALGGMTAMNMDDPSVSGGRAAMMQAVVADAQAAAALERGRPKALRPDAMSGSERAQMLDELRSVKGLIEDRFGALAFMEKLQRDPRQAQLSQRLLECGFSPALVRKLLASLPAEGDEAAWASGVLERNLATGDREAPLEDIGGVYAFIGATGVGKTTSTAKLAAAFAARHGANNLGLVTLDAYRMGAQEQLRAYGRILGVPVHSAHDRASLEDLLELLSSKKLVLIDTGGMAQRDTRTPEMLEMLSHPSVQRLLVVNAAAQGETIEDVLVAYRASQCRGVVLTKVDEAVKLGPALDALIRHRQKVLAVANGQRVPEDWHRLSSATLVQRALRAAGSTAWRLDPSDINLVFAGASPRGGAGVSAGTL